MKLPRMTMLLPFALAAAGAAVPAHAATAARASVNPAKVNPEWLTAKHCVQKSKAEALRHVGFRNADKNGDGYVDMQEAIEAGVWTDVSASYPDFRISRKEWGGTETNAVASADCVQYSKAEALRRVGFDNADRNGDGYVDMHEALNAGVWTDVPSSYPDFRISREEWVGASGNARAGG